MEERVLTSGPSLSLKFKFKQVSTVNFIPSTCGLSKLKKKLEKNIVLEDFK
jgi:hypothetical protein